MPDKKIESHFKEREDELKKGRLEVIRSLDRTLIVLSSGGLALFINLLGRDLWLSSFGKWFLLMTLIGFGISLLSTTLSFKFGEWAYEAERKLNFEQEKKWRKCRSLKEINSNQFVNTYSTRTKWLNNISLILFFVGALFMVLFSATVIFA